MTKKSTGARLKILFIHPNMPGQFKFLCQSMATRHEVAFITKLRPDVSIPGVRKIEYRMARDAGPLTHRYLQPFERQVLQGQEVYRVCRRLNQEGWVPDVIVAHPGWGDTLFIKELWPHVPHLNYGEFYYHTRGSDVGFEPSETPREDDLTRIRMKNATHLFSLTQGDWAVSPTFWQWAQHPEIFRPKVSVLHDGIDTDLCSPDPDARWVAPSGICFNAGDELVTYVGRNLEPYRGFHTFMRAAGEILERRPNCHIVAIGADGVSYGKAPPKGTTYREILLKQTGLANHPRLHFVGRLEYQDFIKVFQVTAAHIYLTYPFVLSWSMVEAMACGALLIGSDTPPVQEVIEDGVNGLLTSFFDPSALAGRVVEALENPDAMRPLRAAARRTAQERYALHDTLPLWEALVEAVAHGDAATVGKQIGERNKTGFARAQKLAKHWCKGA